MALSADRLKAYQPPGSKKQRKTKKGLDKGSHKAYNKDRKRGQNNDKDGTRKQNDNSWLH